ncbi:MAG TPA: M48 family metalloprotease [Terriglobales bacterium]|nr:M48 family metalloprotease [Terriglobales bacterium]
MCQLKSAKLLCAVALVLFLVLPLFGRAQDYDDDDATASNSARLSLRFDKQGVATVNLWVTKAPENWDPIRVGLATALDCPQQNFHSPETTGYSNRVANRLAPANREQYLRSLAEYYSKQLNASCDSVLRWDGFSRSGNLDLSPVQAPLAQSGNSELSVSIAFPAATNIQYSKESLRFQWQRALEYRIDLNAPERPSPIQLSFGITSRSFYKSIAVAIAFILFPLVITLWMRHAALTAGKQDPIAASFGYFRSLNWCIQGSMLLWITSGLGARQALQDWLSLALPPSWEATLLDIAIVLGPAFLIYFACVSVSYRLHVELRGSKWTRREFLLQQLATVGAQVIPLMFFLAALENITADATAAASFFLAAMLCAVALRNLRMRVSQSYPFTLTTGELRDRVFELARKAGVKINQVIILPTGKSQVANAFATGNRVVMFTDYLLQHLNKREVAGVAAHEVAHLQLGHVKKRLLAFYLAILLPALLGGFFQEFLSRRVPVRGIPVQVTSTLYSALGWFWNWSQRDFILIVVGLSFFFLLSRRFEFAADERGAALTGNAEAQISGLLKLSRVNLMPIRWGKGTGTWLTHPSTIRRAERIAAAAGMPAEQLQAILVRHDFELRAGAGTNNVPGANDYYSVPEATDPENIRATVRRRKSQYAKIWILRLIHVLPPALVALLVKFSHLQGVDAMLVYFAGFLATPIICVLLSAQLGVTARKAQCRRLVERSQREGLNLSGGIVVGFSPGAVVRFYGLNFYNWDVGLLLSSGNRLSYIGEQIRFSIDAREIEGVCLGQGGPSWWKFPRVYIRWIQSDGKPSVFSLGNLEPCRVWKLKEQAAELLSYVRTLRAPSRVIASPSTVPELPSLTIGEVTSRQPRDIGGLKANLGVLIYLIPMAIVFDALLRTDATWYLCATIIVTRMIESIPYWRFRDRLLQFNTPSAAAAAATKS